ncbi:MAG TPA: peptidoglycan editing factor PgeF [Burkholderiales bacterium]|nr:peptidoglycan editing factor PgeF [Burkholderiales bacterium]
MKAEFVLPDWPAPAKVRALMTTRALGDMKSAAGRARLRRHLPGEPKWLRQVHGISVVDAARSEPGAAADASVTHDTGVVCAVMAADCMPVLLADEGGNAVGIAHAGWRGLCAGVIEASVAAMGAPASRVIAWLGPAIGADAYEIGEEVRAAFMQRDQRTVPAFRPTRPGHWRLDLYAIARQRLASCGVGRVFGGGFCTASDPVRFYSWRRDKAGERMAAAIWLVP